MAWRSSGTTNDEMVDKLSRFRIISKECVEKGFRNVDRKYFVPKGNEELAYADQPLKEGDVHISAPHIYGSSIDALELETESSLSFLNIGSGTGYLSCIVAEILGPRSLNIGIEIRESAVEHSKEAIRKWTLAKNVSSCNPQIQIIHGNALNICSEKGESLVGFDRMYLGASIEKEELSNFTKLLSPGGILVGPVEDELVKIVRIGSPQVPPRSGNEFTKQILSGVRFAPLLNTPKIDTVIPARIWRPEFQQFYPQAFQMATVEILKCANAKFGQPKIKRDINIAAILPRVIWIEILSYTHRKWFDSPQSEVECLKKRCLEEQANARKERQARLEAESRCLAAERDREFYRLLSRRWQSRVHHLLRQQTNSFTATLSDQPELNSLQGPPSQRLQSLEARDRDALFGLGGLIHSSAYDNMEEDEVESDENDSMIENDDLLERQEGESSDEEDFDFQSVQSESAEDYEDGAVITNHDEDSSINMDCGMNGVNNNSSLPDESIKFLARQGQIRTVSMSENDL